MKIIDQEKGLKGLDLYTEALSKDHTIFELPIYDKTLLLIYKDVPTFWTKEYVKNKLIDFILAYKTKEYKGTSKASAYIISEEVNDGEKSYYCLIELKNRIAAMAIKTLDINGYRGQYKVVRDIEQVIYQMRRKSHIEHGFEINLTEQITSLRESIYKISGDLANVKEKLEPLHFNKKLFESMKNIVSKKTSDIIYNTL